MWRSALVIFLATSVLGQYQDFNQFGGERGRMNYDSFQNRVPLPLSESRIGDGPYYSSEDLTNPFRPRNYNMMGGRSDGVMTDIRQGTQALRSGRLTPDAPPAGYGMMGRGYRNPSMGRMEADQPTENLADDSLSNLGEVITMTGKWDEFRQKTDEYNKQFNGQVDPNWEQEVEKWIKWKKDVLAEYNQAKRQNKWVATRERNDKPNPGMEAYWGERNIEEQPRQRPPGRGGQMPGAFPDHFGGGPPRSPKDILSTDIGKKRPALSKGYLQKAMENLKTMVNNQEPAAAPANNPTLPPQYWGMPALDPTLISANYSQKNLPMIDDFNSPIKWVRFNSHETLDGLAKLTDPKTGTNLQITMNGSVYVPVKDYRIQRLGVVTKATTIPPATAHPAALRTIVNSVDLEKVDSMDWLIIELATAPRYAEQHCDTEGCQSRCYAPACETLCAGDTCATGCVGTSCGALCKGPGCLAMCVGQGCNAMCEGMSCDARCRGRGCTATCSKLSCIQAANGVLVVGSGGTWSENYPQYEQNVPGPSQYDN